MPRVPEVSPATATPEQKKIIDALVKSRGSLRGPFKVMLHSPKMADACQQLGTFVRFEGQLEPRIKSLVAIITGRFLDARVEWSGNVETVRKGGMSEETIEAIRERRRPTFSRPEDEAVYDMATELHRNHEVSDATFARCIQLFGVQGTVELVGVIGYYRMVGPFLKTFQIEPAPEVPKAF
jgi:4-carboxymuconolactone decarboxylase